MTEAPSGWRIVRALLGAGLALLAAVAYAPAFSRTPAEALGDHRFTGTVAGAVGVVTVTCLLLAIATRAAPVTRVAVALVALTSYVVLVLAPGRAFVAGPKRLLTTALPIDPAGPELATVVAVIGLAALGAVEPALRRRASLLPLVTPLIAAGAGMAVAASSGPPAWWLAPAFALGAAGLLLAARRDSAVTRTPVAALRGALSVSRVTAVLGGLAVAALCGPLLVGWAGSGGPADARDLVAQPVQPRQLTTPLQLYPALRSGRQSLLLTVRTTHRPTLLRYVSLDHFDGQYWTTSAKYRRAGKRLPLASGVGPTTTRTERVRLIRPGPLGWLVSSGRPTEVSVGNLGVNEDTGDVAFPAGRPLPSGYTVTSAVPAASRAQLRTATPAPLPPEVGRAADDRDAAPPGELVTAATTATAGEYGYPALQRLAEFFADGDFAVDKGSDPPSGHGLYQLQRLFDSKVGTPEQYASAYAVLARALGYHARVVVGFRPATTDQPDVYRVTGRDVHAWAEVEFDGLGWVPFDPTPSRAGHSSGSVPGAEPSESPSPSHTSPNVPVTPWTTPPGAHHRTDLAARAGSIGLPLVAVLTGLMLVTAVVVVLAKRSRRRRRRTTPDPRGRTLAAWRETVERLVESGLPVARSDTSVQVVTGTRGRFGPDAGESIGKLARLRDLAAYSSAAVSASAGDTAWLHADLTRRSVRQALTRLRRLRAWLDPRPLLRGHR